jgi:N6-adenosine-specific RNA methylase IME4
LGITPAIKQFFGDEIDAIQFVMRTNKRRNLTSSQWAAIAVEADEVVEAIRQAVEVERRKKQAESLQQTHESGMFGAINCPKQSNEENKARTKIAQTFNTNRTYVNEAAKLRETKPEVFEQVKRGEKTLTEVKSEEKKEIRKAEIERQIADIESGNLPELHGTFEVVAIDPPWAYEERGGMSSSDYDPEVARGVTLYPTMKISEIKEIELPLSPDAVVFLWTTHAFLKDAFSIIEHWGLSYKATMVWDKEKMGIGRTIRMQCEFCLIAFKGRPVFNGNSERDIIREARREHSRKPDAFYSFVERATIGRKLEYFSREKRKGWDIYGNDTEKF